MNGNQSYSVSVSDDASTPEPSTGTGEAALVLGWSDEKGNSVSTASAGLPTALSVAQPGQRLSESYGFFRHFYVAYDRSKFPDGGRYELKNSITYTLTDDDDKAVTATTDTASTFYEPVRYLPSSGHFSLYKRGDGDVTRNLYDSRGVLVETRGVYATALDRLARGLDAEIWWRVQSRGFGYEWTYQDDGDGEVTEADYGKQPYDMEIDDQGVTMGGLGELGADDGEFSKLVVRDPVTYAYGKYAKRGWGYVEAPDGSGLSWGRAGAGSWAYSRDDDSATGRKPDVDVYARSSDSGAWSLVAHLSFYDRSKSSASGGATLSDDGTRYEIGFPAGTTRWKVSYSSRPGDGSALQLAGVDLDLEPHMILHGSAKGISDEVAGLFSKDDDPSVLAVNRARMVINSTKGEVGTIESRLGRDELYGARYGVVAKQGLDYVNEPASGDVKLHYSTEVDEQSNLVSQAEYQAAIDEGSVYQETGGTFYELLPKGATVDPSSVSLRSGDEVRSVRVIDDFRGSGRQLLVVSAKLSPRPESNPWWLSVTGRAGIHDVPRLDFEATYDWTCIDDYGAALDCVAVFESDGDKLGTTDGMRGEPDDPAHGNNSSSSTAIERLDPADLLTGVHEAVFGSARATDSYVYAADHAALAVDRYSAVSLRKTVSVTGHGTRLGQYGDGLDESGTPMNVYEGGAYRYRLRMTSAPESTATDIVLFDAIESYVPADGKPDAGDTQWKGRLTGVDTRQLSERGVAPIVFYSTRAGVEFSDDAYMDLSDSSTWTTTAPADLSDVTAVAIDCSKSADGSDFSLGPGESVQAMLDMRAPMVRSAALAGEDASDDVARQWYDSSPESSETGLDGGAHAYNMAATRASQSVNGGTPVEQVTRNEYVKVGLLPASVTVEKVWDDDNDNDGF